MTHLIHLNDNNLLTQAGGKLTRSQGYAWLKGDDVIFDTGDAHSPVKHCRLAPQEINSRYWQQCDESSVAGNGANMRHAADLIWRHLSELKQHHTLQNVILIVPSHYRQPNLQLLLGVAKSAGVLVTGLVNKAVMALQGQTLSEGEYMHLDVQLHQMVSSTLKVQNGAVKLGAVEIIQDVGIHAIQEALLKGLQQSFIQNDRFDPLHDAETEQQLFDQLPKIMHDINESAKATVGVQHQGRSHSTSLDAKHWHGFLEPFVKRILSVGAGGAVQHVYVDLNNVFDKASPQTLSGSSLSVVDALSSGALSDAAIDLLQRREDDAVVYVTELPLIYAGVSNAAQVEPKTLAASTASQSVVSRATHLLHAGNAIELARANVTTEANVLGLRNGEANVVQMLASGKLYIMNDEQRRELQPNDRLGSQFADGVITAIQVL